MGRLPKTAGQHTDVRSEAPLAASRDEAVRQVRNHQEILKERFDIFNEAVNQICASRDKVPYVRSVQDLMFWQQSIQTSILDVMQKVYYVEHVDHKEAGL